MSDQALIPEWVATLIGRLTLENEAMRRVLAEANKPESQERQ
jgi:hypothetical protein